MPVSKAKRKSTLRRKRIEYHRHITKHYFEFDFCLTDRKLPSNPTPTASPAKTLSSPNGGGRKSMSSQLQKLQSDTLFQASLMPLFSQPSTTPKQKKNTTREDSLLLQIRHDINQMVKIPVSSSRRKSSSSKWRAKSRDQRQATKNRTGKTLLGYLHMTKRLIKNKNNNNFTFPSHHEDDMHENNTTTTNRLFANSAVKSSLERILYLWSIRIKSQKHQHHGNETRNATGTMLSNTSTASRYIPGMVDIVYPLYLSILHGYVWDTHLSTTLDNIDDENESSSSCHEDINEQTHFLTKLGRKEDDQDEDEYDEDNDEEEKSSHHQSEVLENEARLSKIKYCRDLSIGKGIDQIPEEIMDEVEADTFWCLENMMNAIQDYRYNDAFFSKNSSSSSTSEKFKHRNADGLQSMIVLTEKVLERVDPVLHSHLKSKGVEFQWFTFRWMNTLHVRTMNERCVIRLWDTCLCEEIDRDKKGGLGLSYFTTFGFNPKRSKKRLHLSGFLSFQVYICAALMHQIRDKILSEQKFEDILYRLRNFSLHDWEIDDVMVLLSQAFVWKETFCNSEDQLLASATSHYGDDTLTTWVKKCHWPPRNDTSKPTDPVKNPKVLHSGGGRVLSL